MANFTAKDVQQLRKNTGAGMMDCKKALEDSDGDFEAAVQLLREKGLAKAGARSDRDASQGTVAIAADGNRAALVELKAETDFSAKAEDFVALVDELAQLVLAGGEEAVAQKQTAIEDLNIQKKENISLGKVVRFEAAEGAIIDAYLHRQDGRGVIGVLLEATGVDAETLHEIALHAAFAKPRFLRRDEVPAEAAAKERASLLEITKAEGKPEAAWEKIVDGRLNSWYGESVLLEQGVHGDKETVAQRIGNGTITRMAIAVIGG
ncbi:MAG: translation elongation factor Ts [Acidimicrobiia bacterium]|nr:translation elongation factor Ts [Acidimicrobiia bacterium]